MARSTVVHITDDLDGSSGAEEVSFAYRGVDYTIDLGKKNRAAFEKALKPYLDAATRVRKPSRSRSRASSASSRVDLAAVRAWARDQGIEVSTRGRIPQSVLEQYEASR